MIGSSAHAFAGMSDSVETALDYSGRFTIWENLGSLVGKGKFFPPSQQNK